MAVHFGRLRDLFDPGHPPRVASVGVNILLSQPTPLLTAIAQAHCSAGFPRADTPAACAIFRPVRDATGIPDRLLPRHAMLAPSAGSSVTGMRSCGSAISEFAAVVMMEKVRRIAPSARRGASSQTRRTPSAGRTPRAMAYGCLPPSITFRACNANAGTIAPAGVSVTELASGRACIDRQLWLARPFRPVGREPHCTRSKWRSPVSGCRRTTGAGCRGPKFHDALDVEHGLTVPKTRRSTSVGRRLA